MHSGSIVCQILKPKANLPLSPTPTGCGMFILLLLILYVESVVSVTTLWVLTMANLSSALLAAYYAFYDDQINYKLMEKPYTVNLL